MAGGQTGGRSRVLQPISVTDVLAEDVVTADPETPIRTVVAAMDQNDVGSVVVVEDGEPVGIVTDRKIALALEETPDVAEQPVENLVADRFVTADTSVTIFEVAQRMSDEGIRRMPVVDDEGRLQGIVTLDDVIVLLGSELNNAAETIRSQIPRL